MPQISLYIDESTLKKVELEAKREHVSISKWVFQQIKNKLDPQYPAGYEDLFGSIEDDTFFRHEQNDFSIDLKREVI